MFNSGIQIWAQIMARTEAGTLCGKNKLPRQGTLLLEPVGDQLLRRSNSFSETALIARIFNCETKPTVKRFLSHDHGSYRTFVDDATRVL